jgi:hypothetical protein
MSIQSLTVVVRGVRRAVGLHGDALRNAEQAVRRDDRARSNRNRIADQIRTIHEAYPTEPAAAKVDRVAP